MHVSFFCIYFWRSTRTITIKKTEKSKEQDEYIDIFGEISHHVLHSTYEYTI